MVEYVSAFFVVINTVTKDHFVAGNNHKLRVLTNNGEIYFFVFHGINGNIFFP